MTTNLDQARAQARKAMSLLDGGDITGTRALLADIAGEPNRILAYVVDVDSQTAASVNLSHSVMSCIIGSEWTRLLSDSVQQRTPTEPALPWDSVCRDSWPTTDVISPPADSQTYADYLVILKQHLVSHPSELSLAHDCMSRIGSVARNLQLGRDGFDSMAPVPNYEETLRALLRIQQASQSVGERAMRRLIWAAREYGMPQREIASLIQRSQTQVFRQLKSIDEDPALLALSPREILDTHKSGRFDRATFLKILAAYPYTQGEFPEDEPDWGYVPGSWDDLTEMAIEGEISRAELDLVISAARARADVYG